MFSVDLFGIFLTVLSTCSINSEVVFHSDLLTDCTCADMCLFVHKVFKVAVCMRKNRAPTGTTDCETCETSFHPLGHSKLVGFVHIEFEKICK